MNPLFFRNLIFLSLFINFSIDARKKPREPKAPKEKIPMTQEQKQAIVSGVTQVLHSIINIVAQKIVNRTIDIHDEQAIKECIEELYQEYNYDLL